MMGNPWRGLTDEGEPESAHAGGAQADDGEHRGSRADLQNSKPAHAGGAQADDGEQTGGPARGRYRPRSSVRIERRC